MPVLKKLLARTAGGAALYLAIRGFCWAIAALGSLIYHYPIPPFTL